MPEIREFMKQFYILDDWVRQFLIVGEEEALLIDTGVEESHVAEAVRQITSLPVRVVLTHGDHDHAGGLGAFGSCLVHPEDADMLPPEIRWQPLREGDTLECGGYRFEVLHIPGHTPGSQTVVVDTEKGKYLLVGDNFYTMEQFTECRMNGNFTDLEGWYTSRDKVIRYMEEHGGQILCVHNPDIYSEEYYG